MPATQWWEACGNGSVGLSLPVRMALLRLLSNARVMGGSVLRPAAAWKVVQSLPDDPRVETVDAVLATHGRHWYGNIARRAPSPDLWTDAWLAALAQALGCEMATFDRGFRSFAGPRLRLLEAAG